MRSGFYFLLFIFCAGVCFGQERWQARSMTASRMGIVATSQTLASQAGSQILARGGSAVDAAIAANAVLSVVEPMMCGIGGDLFVIHRDGKTGKITGLDGSGWAGKAQTVDNLRMKGFSTMPAGGIHTATVPGAVDGWWRMHKKFGKLRWNELFRPAIYYAEQGFPVTEIIQYDWEHTTSKLSSDDNARRVFLHNGQAPKVGEIFKNPELARALRLIADGGVDAFYRGPIRTAILQTSKRLGGLLQESDFAEFQTEWIDPISVDYRGWKVYEMPPSGQGIAALMMLNVMDRFPIPSLDAGGTDAWHYKIESQKLAYQDLRRYVADPRMTKVPAAEMISKKYAAERAALIDAKKAGCDFEPGNPETGHTIYLSVIDKEGNIVSWIQSISDMWGSGVAVDGMGFHLHDRGGSFTTDRSHPNVLAARKRPFHTIIPALMEKGSQHIGFGIMRGGNQAQAHAQFVSNVADHNMNIQAALEAPRFTRQYLGGCEVLIESRVPADTIKELRERGHSVDLRGEYSGLMGGGQAVMLDDSTGVHFGASSPRKDGAAIPEPDPYFKLGAEKKK